MVFHDILKATYTENNGESGCVAFHTFLQDWKIDLVLLCDEGVIPKRSIFMSPLISRGIGCASEELGIENGLFVSAYL